MQNSEKPAIFFAWEKTKQSTSWCDGGANWSVWLIFNIKIIIKHHLHWSECPIGTVHVLCSSIYLCSNQGPIGFPVRNWEVVVKGVGENLARNNTSPPVETPEKHRHTKLSICDNKTWVLFYEAWPHGGPPEQHSRCSFVLFTIYWQHGRKGLISSLLHNKRREIITAAKKEINLLYSANLFYTLVRLVPACTKVEQIGNTLNLWSVAAKEAEPAALS